MGRDDAGKRVDDRSMPSGRRGDGILQSVSVEAPKGWADVVPLVAITACCTIPGSAWAESVFRWVIDRTSEEFLLFWGPPLWVLIIYTTYTLALAVLDLWEKPAFLLRYRVQGDTSVDPRMWLRSVPLVLFNLMVVNVFFNYVMRPLLVWRGTYKVEFPGPSFWTCLVNLIGIILWQEVLFYYAHRTLHYGPLYRAIHKLHHTWKSPCGLVAVYANPIEHILSNVGPVAICPFIMGASIQETYVWFTIAIASTITSHSGYAFPLFPKPYGHDYHHMKFNAMYGVIGILDALHGTTGNYVKHREEIERREKTL